MMYENLGILDSKTDYIRSRQAICLIFPLGGDPWNSTLADFDIDQIVSMRSYTMEDFKRLQAGRNASKVNHITEIFLDPKYMRVVRANSITSDEWTSCINWDNFSEFLRVNKCEKETPCVVHCLQPLKYSIKDLRRRYGKETRRRFRN